MRTTRPTSTSLHDEALISASPILIDAKESILAGVSRRAIRDRERTGRVVEKLVDWCCDGLDFENRRGVFVCALARTGNPKILCCRLRCQAPMHGTLAAADYFLELRDFRTFCFL
jgi:hypothetical protein